MALQTSYKSPALVDFLLNRRSTPLKIMDVPGPDRAQIQTILKIAARVPDHGKMFPWYFIVFEGDARTRIGAALQAAWLAEDASASAAKLELEAEKFLRAPVVIAVVSKMRAGKNPFWEQILSAGAACMNLCLAANALGFATNWLTEWYAYSPTFKQMLGLAAGENIAGFVYIGSATETPEERDRPDMDQIVTWWDGAAPNKGALYDKDGKDFPPPGFDLP